MKRKYHAVFNITKGTLSLYENISLDVSRFLLKLIASYSCPSVSNMDEMEIWYEKNVLFTIQDYSGLDFGNDLENVSMYWIISPSY